MPVHGSVASLSSGWQKRMYHWIMQPATSAIPRTHVTHQLRRSARASVLFSLFFFLRRIAQRERSAFTRRAQYLEDRVLPSLPSFAPFHLFIPPPPLPSLRARGSLTWPGETHTRVLTRTLNRTQRSDERILQRLLYDGKGWRTAGWKYESVKGEREKEWERKKRAFTCKRSHIRIRLSLSLSLPFRIAFLLFFRYVRSRNVVYSRVSLSPLNTFFSPLFSFSFPSSIFSILEASFIRTLYSRNIERA